MVAALGEVQRPTHGFQLGNAQNGLDVIMPSVVTQCDPVSIYYNLHNTASVRFEAPDILVSDILYLLLPAGVGYLDWVCNIPVGYSFVAGYIQFQYYTVQPGSSSACLTNVTTSYSYARYITTAFQSYTQHSPTGHSDLSIASQQPTIAFPTSSFSTITANPNLAATSTTTTTTTPTVSSTLSSSTISSLPETTSSPHKLTKAVIGGSVVGGVAVVVLAFAIIFIFLRKRQAPVSLTPYTGFVTSQFEPTSLPAHSSDRERHVSHADSTNTVHRGVYNTSQTAVSDTRSRTKSRDPGADLASAFDAVQRLTASQKQALVASLNASVDPAAPQDASPPPPSPLQLATISETTEEDLPDIATVLGVISRAQLSPRERRALVASLNNLLMPQASTRSSPPPYTG